MNLQTLITFLHAWRACDPSLGWLRSLPGDTTTEQAWVLCPRADWLLWLLEQIGFDRRFVVLAACACAERALGAVPDGDERPMLAIEEARLWCAGERVTAGRARVLHGVRTAFLDAPRGSREEPAALSALIALENTTDGMYPAWRAASRAADAIAGPCSEDVEAELARMADLVRMHVPWSAVEARLAEVLP